MPTNPPAITPPPEVPQRGVKATFGKLVDAFNTWKAASVAQFAAVALNTYNNAVEAFNSATSSGTSAGNAATSATNAAMFAQAASDFASAASVTTGATLWVSGQVVQRDAAVISPADRRTYRRKTAAGSGATDPSVDATNYVLLSADASSFILLGTATVASAVASINFLNVFSDVYSSYQIEVEGLTTPVIRQLFMRLAVAGVVNSESVYYTSATPGTQIAGTTIGTGGAAFTIEIRGARSTLAKGVGIKGMSQADMFRGMDSEHCFDKSSPVSGFQLYLELGANFSAGTVRVYGIRK